MSGELDRLVEQRLVRDHPPRLEPAGRRYDDHRLCVRDPGRQFRRRKASEDDGVDGTEPGAGEHGDHGLRDHRHVHNHAIAFSNTQVVEDARERGDLVRQLGIRERLDGSGDRAVVDQRLLVRAAFLEVTVQAVVRGVALGSDEPAAVHTRLRIERL